MPSKASEWARAMKENPPLRFPATGIFIAMIEDTAEGLHLQLRDQMLTVETALKLARWILDTFGEDKK